MWAIVKKALNSTVGAKMKPLDDIVEEKLYEKYYNDCLTNHVAMKYGETDLSIRGYIVPNGTVTVKEPNDYIYTPVTVRSLILPITAKEIYSRAFYQYTNIECIVLPPRLQTIGNSAFYNNMAAKQITFPKSIGSLEANSFGRCSSLKTVVFKGRPSNVSPSAFAGCSGIDFYVPWSEDDMPGGVYLPAGASDSTIHYNSEV